MHDDDTRKRPEELELVTFLLGAEQYGLDIMSVQEIIRMPELTRAPQSPDFVAGILNLRGVVLPVIDLRRRMGKAPRAHDTRTRVVIVSRGELRFGLVVDAVADVLRLAGEDIQQPPGVVRNEDAALVSGVARMSSDRLLLVLDLATVLAGMGAEPQASDRRESDMERHVAEHAPGVVATAATVIPLDPTVDVPRRSLRRAA